MNTSSCGFYFCSPFVNVKNRILKNNPFQRSRILPRAPDPQQCSWSTRGQLRMVSLPDSAHTAGPVPAPAPPFPASASCPQNLTVSSHQGLKPGTTPIQVKPREYQLASFLAYSCAFSVHSLAFSPEQKHVFRPAFFSFICLYSHRTY